MLHAVNIVRISLGVVGGLVFGSVVVSDFPHSTTTVATIPSLPSVTATNDSLVDVPVRLNSPPLLSVGDMNGGLASHASWHDPILSKRNEQSFGADSLADQVDLATEEMRQLDRLELPARAAVADRLYQRLCTIGEQLDSRDPTSTGNLVMDARDGNEEFGRIENFDYRGTVRGLLAAIAIAPEKCAYVSRASVDPCHAANLAIHSDKSSVDGSPASNRMVIVGDVRSIKQTDDAWFFLLTDPYHQSQQYTVRMELQRLHQRIELGDHVVVLGNCVADDIHSDDLPIVATEMYGVGPFRKSDSGL